MANLIRVAKPSIRVPDTVIPATARPHPTLCPVPHVPRPKDMVYPPSSGYCATITLRSNGAADIPTGGDGHPSGFGPSWIVTEVDTPDNWFTSTWAGVPYLQLPAGVTYSVTVTASDTTELYMSEVGLTGMANAYTMGDVSHLSSTPIGFEISSDTPLGLEGLVFFSLTDPSVNTLTASVTICRLDSEYSDDNLDTFWGIALSPTGRYLYGVLGDSNSAVIARWTWPDLDDPEIIVADDPAVVATGAIVALDDYTGLYVDDTYVWWVSVPSGDYAYLKRQLISGGPIETFANLIGEAEAPGGDGWFDYFLVGSNGKLWITYYRSITEDPPGPERGIWETGYLEIDPAVPNAYTRHVFSYDQETLALNFVDGFPITVADDGAIWQPSVTQGTVHGPDVPDLALTRFDPVTGVFTSTTVENPSLDVFVAAARDGNVYGTDFEIGSGKRVLVTPSMEVLDDPCFEGVQIPDFFSFQAIGNPIPITFTSVTSVDVDIAPTIDIYHDTTESNIIIIRATVAPNTPAGWTRTIDTGVLSDGTTAVVLERDADTTETLTVTFPSSSTGYWQRLAINAGWTVTARDYGIPGDTSVYSRTIPDTFLAWWSLGIGGGGYKGGQVIIPENDAPVWSLGWIVWEVTTDVWADWETTPDGYWTQWDAAVESADHSLQFFVSRDENPTPTERVFIVSERRSRGVAIPSTHTVKISTENMTAR